ncbi:MAG TPA: phosphoglucosamine mutase [Pirellulales bacterium]|nr:phosphoglucosamine mutase [Pirellulales bacterium]
MTEPIISVSGLRGVVGDSLTPLVALRYVSAFAEIMPPGAIVLTRDGRATGGPLADVIRGGLLAAGRDCLDAGIAATPTTGVLVRQHAAAGGIQISASHNPPEYNGLKLFSSEGRVIPAALGEQVAARYRSGGGAWAPHSAFGNAMDCGDTIARHLQLVLATVDVERIRRRRFQVLLDSNHGSGSVLGEPLLAALGCETVIVGGEPDGLFGHPPEPIAENLTTVSRQVVAAGAAIGFCQDPDADRLAIVDEKGRYLGEEYTLALCAAHLLGRKTGAIVTNCSTSRMTQDLAARRGAPFFHSAVGEANVVDVMRAQQAVLGGEGNGGVIHPQVGYVRDSFVGMALVLDALAARELPISALADELPRYEIVKIKIGLPPEKVASGLDRLQQHFGAARADRLDGLRLDWPGKWLLVRASNTEPIVRAIAEAETVDDARQLCDEAARVLNSL